MKEIIILYEFPLILTKDKHFISQLKDWKEKAPPHYRGGRILVIPEDAILVMPPINVSVEGLKLKHD